MASLERFGHGGDLLTASELFSRKQDEWIDFSSNIYPYGPPEIVKEVIQEAIEDREMPVLSRYPDPACRGLKQAIARFHQISADMVLPGNGAAELIDLLIQAFRPSRVGVVDPSFVEYRQCARKRKIPVDHLVTGWEQQFLPSLEEMDRLLRRVDLLFIGYPNNPTGHLYDAGQMLEWLRRAGRYQTILVVDEAFMDFVEPGEDRSLISWVKAHPQLIVVRSMTKFFSLPGLRLGYLVADEAVISRIRTFQVPWSVNGLAQTIGCAVLRDEVYRPHARKVSEWLETERETMIRELNRLDGFQVFPGVANYLLVRMSVNGKTVSDLQFELARKGVLIRSCSNYEGLEDDCFRIAVKKPEQNLLLRKTLEEWSRKEGGLSWASS
jgi:threonine-phosphate decarboxylase